MFGNNSSRFKHRHLRPAENNWQCGVGVGVDVDVAVVDAVLQIPGLDVTPQFFCNLRACGRLAGCPQQLLARRWVLSLSRAWRPARLWVWPALPQGLDLTGFRVAAGVGSASGLIFLSQKRQIPNAQLCSAFFVPALWLLILGVVVTP